MSEFVRIGLQLTGSFQSIQCVSLKSKLQINGTARFSPGRRKDNSMFTLGTLSNCNRSAIQATVASVSYHYRKNSLFLAKIFSASKEPFNRRERREHKEKQRVKGTRKVTCRVKAWISRVSFFIGNFVGDFSKTAESMRI